MSRWVSWQRMPSRYQLTRRDAWNGGEVEGPEHGEPNRRPASARLASPRHPNRHLSSAPVLSPRQQGNRRGLESLVSPRHLHSAGSRQVILQGHSVEGRASARNRPPGAEDTGAWDDPDLSAPTAPTGCLPARNSAYINTLKHQKWIATARRQMVEWPDETTVVNDPAKSSDRPLHMVIGRRCQPHPTADGGESVEQAGQLQPQLQQVDALTASPALEVAIGHDHGGRPRSSPAGPIVVNRHGQRVRNSAINQEKGVPNELYGAAREHVTTPRERVTTPREHVTTPREHVTTPRERVTTPREHLNAIREPISTPREHNSAPIARLGTPRGRISTPRERVRTPRELVNTPREHVATPREHLSTPREHSATPREHISTPREPVHTPREPVNTPREPVNTPRERISTPKDGPSAPTEPVSTPREHIATPREHISTPRERVGTPREHIGTPRERVGTPRERVGIPRERAGSPRQRVSSPREGVGTPRKHRQPRVSDLQAVYEKESPWRQELDGFLAEPNGPRHGENSVGLRDRAVLSESDFSSRDVSTSADKHVTAVLFTQREDKPPRASSADVTTYAIRSASSTPRTVARDDGSYMCQLRKDYLSRARDLSKTARPKAPKPIPQPQPQPPRPPERRVPTAPVPAQPEEVMAQRAEYDRRVGDILEYYTKVEVSKQLHGPRPLDAPHPFPPPSTLPGKPAFRPLAARRKKPRASTSARGSKTANTVLNLDCKECPFSPRAQTLRRPQSACEPRSGRRPYSPRDALPQSPREPRSVVVTLPRSAGPALSGVSSGDVYEASDPDGFVRIHVQATLHDRPHFYLQTPCGQEGPGDSLQHAVPEVATSTCTMCCLEREMTSQGVLPDNLGGNFGPVAEFCLGGIDVGPHRPDLIPVSSSGLGVNAEGIRPGTSPISHRETVVSPGQQKALDMPLNGMHPGQEDDDSQEDWPVTQDVSQELTQDTVRAEADSQHVQATTKATSPAQSRASRLTPSQESIPGHSEKAGESPSPGQTQEEVGTQDLANTQEEDDGIFDGERNQMHHQWTQTPDPRSRHC